jgi:nucleoside-diphosphate-sugar epimerase
VVTGASGWIGLTALDLLKRALGDCMAYRVVAFGSAERILRLSDGSDFPQAALADLAALEPCETIVIHLAFLTKDRAETMDDASFIGANRAIDTLVLDALDPIGARAVFIASSGAATRADDLRSSAAMRLYGMLKRQQEKRFTAWAQARNRNAVIGRIFNISGPNINKQESYALACFISDVLAGRPIAIRAARPVVRSYVAVRELLSLVFALLLDTRCGVTRFDSGGKAMEMAEIATTVSRLLGPVPIERAPPEMAEADEYVGDARGYDCLLAEFGIESVSFERQVLETADFLRLSAPH